MKAAVLYKPNEPLQVVDFDGSRDQGGRGAGRVKASGVCESDWHIMNGDWPSPMPIVPGHEAAGEIAECGPGVTTVKPGDHVIFSFRPHCGRCRYCSRAAPSCASAAPTCRRARSTTAPSAQAQGPGHQPDGAHRHLLRGGGRARRRWWCRSARTCRGRRPPWSAAACATGVGAVTRRAKVEAGSSVLVIGCGGVGLNAVQGAMLSGAGMIIAADILDNKLEMAKDLRRDPYHQHQDQENDPWRG